MEFNGKIINLYIGSVWLEYLYLKLKKFDSFLVFWFCVCVCIYIKIYLYEIYI